MGLPSALASVDTPDEGSENLIIKENTLMSPIILVHTEQYNKVEKIDQCNYHLSPVYTY